MNKKYYTLLIAAALCVSCGGGGKGSEDKEENVACQNNLDENDLLAAINNIRSTSRECGGTVFPPAKALQWHQDLLTIAENHSNDMAENNFFSHTGSDGLTVDDRASAVGYESRYVGENISAGTKTHEEAINNWLKSEGHCQNIMDPEFNDYAIACFKNSKSDYEFYWTQVFGRE